MSRALRGLFSQGKADDAGVLSPGKEENEALRKKDCKDWTGFKLVDYNCDERIIGNVQASQ